MLTFATLTFHRSDQIRSSSYFYCIFLAACDIPVLVYYGPNGVSYQVAINGQTTSGNLVSDNVEEMSYDHFSRQLFYYVDNSDTFFAIKEDGSEKRQSGSATHVGRFTVDGRNDNIYYINTLTNTVHLLQTGIDIDLDINGRDIDMDSINK